MHEVLVAPCGLLRHHDMGHALCGSHTSHPRLDAIRTKNSLRQPGQCPLISPLWHSVPIKRRRTRLKDLFCLPAGDNSPYRGYGQPPDRVWRSAFFLGARCLHPDLSDGYCLSAYCHLDRQHRRFGNNRDSHDLLNEMPWVTATQCVLPNEGSLVSGGIGNPA